MNDEMKGRLMFAVLFLAFMGILFGSACFSDYQKHETIRIAIAAGYSAADAAMVIR